MLGQCLTSCLLVSCFVVPCVSVSYILPSSVMSYISCVVVPYPVSAALSCLMVSHFHPFLNSQWARGLNVLNADRVTSAIHVQIKWDKTRHHKTRYCKTRHCKTIQSNTHGMKHKARQALPENLLHRTTNIINMSLTIHRSFKICQKCSIKGICFILNVAILRQRTSVLLL